MTSRSITLALALVLTTACTDNRDGTTTVLAAASLTQAFEALADQYERDNPDAQIELGFGGSSELATQIEDGAPADVFASADEANMQRVIDRGDADARVVFARNRLAIAVEPGNPLGIESLADLAEPGVIVVLCATQVPCGTFADEVLANAGVSLTPASRAENVRAALATVELGEADAALVYVTDVERSDAVEGVEIPDTVNVVARYAIATLRQTSDGAAARAFVDYVVSPAGQRVLARFGFLPP